MAKASTESAERPASVLWVVAYPLYAVFAAMVFLSARELAQPVVTRSALPFSSEDAGWEASFPARVEALQKALMDSALALKLTREGNQGAGALRWTHRAYDLIVADTARGEVEVKLATLQAVDPGVVLTAENVFNGEQVLIGIDGLLTHSLRLYWSDEASQPRLSVLVGALGDDLRLAREVIDIAAPLALAVRPFRPFSAQVAELGHLFERDVFVQWHVGQEPGDLAAALKTVPGAVGVAFAASPQAPADLQAEVEGKGLMMLQIGGPLSRPGALEKVASFALSRSDADAAQQELVRQARRSGHAIGVVEAGAENLEALRGLLGKWHGEKIEIVQLTQLAPAPDSPPPRPPP